MANSKLILLAALTAGAAMAQTVYCSSDDMRRHYCGADTRGGVQMVRQRSDASCIAGRTWGYDARGIWVDRGCRADFALSSGYRSGGYGGYGNGGYGNGPWGTYSGNGYPNGGYPSGGYGSSVYCASDDMRRHYCGVDTSGGVQMIRQRSDASCIAGRTWGYDRRGLWVDRGCRADFAVNTGNGRYGNGGYNNGGYNNGGYGGYGNRGNGRGRGPWWRRD